MESSHLNEHSMTMDLKKLIFGILIGLLLLGSAFWLLSKMQGQGPALVVDEKPALAISNQIRKSIPPTKSWKNPDGSYKPWTGGVSKNLSDPRWEEIHRRDKEDHDWQWKMPITFYGKVVDEKGQSVERATIKFDWNDLSSRGTSFAETKSDVQGLFSLVGKNGKILGVKVFKDGYHTSREKNQPSFEYAAFWENNFHEADTNNPVIFHLRKKGETEPLIYRQTLFGFSANGAPGYLDLMEGKNRKEQSGDIIVRLTRGPKDEKGHFDWSVTFQAVDGGFLESTDEFMFVAPESGYQQSFEVKMSKDDPQWRLELKKKFYVKSRAGKLYASVEVDIISQYNQEAAIDVKAFVNPFGSRNLEYDPEKQIKP